MESFNSIYLGIVIQNDDPEQRGRVKAWVPHINPTTYDKWDALKKDRSFKFPGLNINSDLSLVIDEVKELMPWAEQCSPIAGELSSGQYNAFNDTATVSDASYSYSLSGSSYSNTQTQYNLNEEKFGEKPGYIYEKYDIKMSDGFTNTSSNKTSKVNPYGNNYRPSTYSNAAKGIFAIPNVGAHVWVFFRDGSPLYPVYFGATFGEEDFKSIFQSTDDTSQDYPQTFENRTFDTVDESINDKIYRNKMVINQRGAAIEIINTTDRERFKITHFQGGFLEFNNKFNSLFSPKNLQLLTLRDKFETVRGHNNLFINRDSDKTVQGDYLLKVGNLNKNALDEWVEAYTAIADLLKLPEGSAGKDSLASTVEEQAEALATAEAKLGLGGNYVETITKHMFSNVGLVFNTFDSYRFNLTDKTVNRYRNVGTSATEYVTADIDLVEYTHIDDMPGGNFTHTIGNRYTLLVGSGGIDAKTTGPINLGGTIIAVGGVQTNIASQKDFNIDGGTNLSVIADIILIRSRNRDQTLVDDNLGVTKNVVIGGGAYVNGELYLQHVTAPYEFQVTESTTIQDTGYTISNATITKVGGGIISSGNTVSITGGTLTIAQPHTHYFKNLPLTLEASANAVRTAASSTVNGGSSAATATAASTHYNTAGGNLNSNPNGPINGVPG